MIHIKLVSCEIPLCYTQELSSLRASNKFLHLSQQSGRGLDDPRVVCVCVCVCEREKERERERERDKESKRVSERDRESSRAHKVYSYYLPWSTRA